MERLWSLQLRSPNVRIVKNHFYLLIILEKFMQFSRKGAWILPNVLLSHNNSKIDQQFSGKITVTPGRTATDLILAP